MKKSQTKNGVIILIFLSVLAKIIGVFYRVPLFAVLGAQGMGIYQLVFPLYALAIALASGGAPVAVARFTSLCLCENNDEKIEKTTDTALVLFGSVGFVLCVGLCVFARYVSEFLGNFDAKLPLIALSPSVFLSTVIAVLRGHCQGVGKTKSVGVSFVSEQFLKLSGIGFALTFSKIDTVLAVVGAMLGITLGEFITALFLTIGYFKNKRFSFSFDKTIIKGLVLCGLSVSVGLLIVPLGNFFEGAIVVTKLTEVMQKTDATALYGLLGGVVNPIISMPAVVTSSFCSWFLPRLCATTKKERRVKFGAYAKLPFVFSLVASFSVLIFAKEILSLLYPLEGDQLQVSVNLLIIGSPIVFVSCALSLVTVYLQSENKSHIPSVNLLIATLIKLAVLPLAVQSFSVYGVQVCSVALYLIAFVLGSIQSIARGFGFSVKTLSFILFLGVSFLLVTGGIHALFPSLLGCIVAFVIGVSVSGIIFIKLANIRVCRGKSKKIAK
ncbi:MAG: hypothetical protein E7353_06105 [Clostridiales bacterium]|nr:hypothetical protein [Clostridiales bacterium]